MNIGIVTVWFERGASYVSNQYKKVLEERGHKIFIYARGGIYAKDDNLFNAAGVTWGKPGHIPVGGTFDLNHFRKWLIDKSLEVVFFNEQTWLDPVILCYDLGIKTGAYIDYYTHRTIPFFRVYDFLICNTKRHFSVFSGMDQCYYIPWGTETDLFKPLGIDLVNKNLVTFFHSCGFSPERKGTDLLINAFFQSNINAKLVIHSQVDLIKKLPSVSDNIIKLKSEKKLEIVQETVGVPGLYYKGDVYIYPSRLEGIGLTIAEALSCGLLVVVPDNPPMNEFVEPQNGFLIKIAKTYRRADDYYWDMCEADLASLASILVNLTNNPHLIPEMKKSARDYAIEKLDWHKNTELINSVFIESRITDSSEKTDLFRRIRNLEYIDDKSIKYRIYKNAPSLFKLVHKLYYPIKQFNLRKL